MEGLELQGFIRGYMMAIANQVRAWGPSSDMLEVYRASGFTIKDLIKAKVDPQDLALIKKLIKEG